MSQWPRSVSVIVFCLSTIGFFFPAVNAEEPKPYELEEVVVSSTRLPSEKVSIYDLPNKITVITADQIRKSGFKTVQEAVQYETGVVLYDQNGNPFQSTVNLRGFSGQPVNATSVFVDGVRVNEPDDNTVNFDLIPIESIERIEILPGPYSPIYGKNALGGVIHIITKRGGERRQVTADTLWGSFQRERYSLNSSGPVGKLDYATSLARETEKGYRDESATRITRYFGKLGVRPSEGTDFWVSYNYTKDRLLQAGIIPLSQIAINRQSNGTPGSFQDNELNLVSVGGRQELPFGFNFSANAFYRHLASELFSVFTCLCGQADQLSKKETRGATVQLSHAVKGEKLANTLIVGTEITRSDLGVKSAGTFGNSQHSIDEDIYALFAHNSLEMFQTVILTAGIRYDNDRFNFQDELDPTGSGSRKFIRSSPRGGIVYKLAPRSSLYFNYAEGFRAPTSDEQFAAAPFTSNLQLRPVHSRGYEFGSKNAFGEHGEVAVALFQTDVRDEIFFTCTVCLFPGFDGVNRNIPKSRRRGLEASGRGNVGKQWSVIVNYTYTEAHFKSHFNLSATRVVDIGDSFPLVPKHRLGTTVQYQPLSEWKFALTGLYASTQFYNNDEANAFPRLNGYFILSGRLAYDRSVPGGKLGVFFEGRNLLNQKYSTYGIIAGSGTRFESPAAGIAFYGGLSYQFESF